MSTVSKWIPTTDLMMLRRMGKLAEELGELGAVAARCIIQGIDEVDPGSNLPNRVRLTDEIADVYAQLDATMDALDLDREIIYARRQRKLGYMRQWEAMFASPPSEDAPPPVQPDSKASFLMSTLDDKGRCCGRKPIQYRGSNPHQFCPRCEREFDALTGAQRKNWAWKQQGDSGEFVRVNPTGEPKQ